MQSEGYGRGYAYDHDTDEAFSGQTISTRCRAAVLQSAGTRIEREIRKRLDYWAKLRKERGGE